MHFTSNLLRLLLAALLTTSGFAQQLYDNLQAFSARLDVGDPAVIAEGLNEGPKGIVAVDLNRDGSPDLAVSNLDGTVTYYRGSDSGDFSEPIHLKTGANSLREIIAADFNQDRYLDLAVAAPFEGAVFVFFNDTQGSFGAAARLDAWIGARNLAAGDFDGDGITDLAVAGPDKGLRHYRGLGDGTFTVVGDLSSLDPVQSSFPKPVYTMRTIPSADGSRDDLIVTHAESTRTWILSAQPSVSEADRQLDGAAQIYPVGIDPSFPVLITEFCASNDSIIADEDGEFSDWIELFNASSNAISLNGWGLGDILNENAKWVFPDVTLEPGRFLLVFASGKDRKVPGANLHTNFKLSSRGEVLSLHRQGNGGFQSFPPPGAPRARLLPDSPLRIVDYGFAATTPIADDTNSKWDWIRIENRSSAVISPGTWGITASTPFGDFSWVPESPSPLASGETITVFFSGRNMKDGLGNLHTPFGLSLLNGVIAITDVESRPLHRLDWTGVGFEFPEQISNISFGLSESGGFHYFDQPTPGWINSAGVESLRELPSQAGAEVRFEQAANGEEIVRVTLLTNEPLLAIQHLWFCYDTSAGEERHAVMLSELDANGANVGNTYTVPVPEGYSDGAGFRIMAAAIDLGNQQEEVTLELARGGASSRNDVPVQPGGLKVAAIIPGQSARALDVGAILLPAAEGVLDLVTANRDSGNLEVRRGTTRSGKFSHSATQVVRVPGGPRSVKIVDLNGDGWNDLIVALRNFDRIVVYKNSNGNLALASEVPTGVSPREVAVADFNGDGQPDAAAINRFSSDVSIVPIFPGTQSLATLDQIYETDGEVVSLTVIDLNDDGRDDVVQLHRASSDVSIRTADPTGRLSEPQFIAIGTSPSAVKLIDVNRDGLLDLVTANLAIGSISVRRATATGYALEEIFPLPSDAQGGLFALEAADFDGDGITDLAAGYFDCRLALYRGTRTGTFEYVRTTRFTYESRVMTTGDFDRDGDIDLAGAGYAGDVVVFENRGDMLTDAEAPRWDYSPQSEEKFGTREISAVDFNGDGDLDLLLGSGAGVMIYSGIEGMLFRPNGDAIDGTDYPTAGAVTGDFDGDGVGDIAVSCRLLSCVSVLRGMGDGSFRVGLSVDVPAGAYLAAGDLDGDGKTDLVGAGDVLWTALSSRKAQAVAAIPESTTRTSNPGIAINEILAINDDIPVATDEDKKTDWIELFNNSQATVSLDGWSLAVETADPDFPATFVFTLPTASSIAAGQHRIVYFSPELRTHLHVGERLPGAKATLTLTDSSGHVVDKVTYPDQQANVAYSRYQDGAKSFVFNPIPSPGAANSYDGSPDPSLSFEGFDYADLKAGRPIKFNVQAEDELGLLGVTVVYQRLDVPGSPPEQFLLYDDGAHGDGGMLDGWYSGTLQPGLPPSGELQFYFVAEDLSGNIIEIPGETVFVNPGEPVRTFSMGLAGIGGPPRLSIVEISAANSTGVTDEAGDAADYVIVRNDGSTPVSLAGISLTKDFNGSNDEAFAFPSGGELAAGDTFIVFADGNENQGSRHAPFKIDSGGESLFLLGTAARGSRMLIDHVVTTAVEPDRILTKIGDTGLWANTAPLESTPGSGAAIWQGAAFTAAGDAVTAIAFTTTPGIDYVIEFDAGQGWVEVSRKVGDGTLSIATQAGVAGTFRVTEIRPPVEVADFHHISATSGKTEVAISGVLASNGGEVPSLAVYVGSSNGGENEGAWAINAVAQPSANGQGFHATVAGIVPGQPYFAKVKATNSAGSAWSESVRFTSQIATAPELADVAVSRPEVDGFRIEGSAPLAEELTIFYGRSDGMEVPGAWEGSLSATVNETGHFAAEVVGLVAGSEYFVRIRAKNSAADAWSTLPTMARTLTLTENLRANLLLTEIMYHPRWDSRMDEADLEYIEIYNASRSPIDLSGLRFVSGIEYDFSKAEESMLAPDSYAVVVANRQAFDYRYAALGAKVLGEWLSPFRITKLSNAGETLTLQYAPTGDIVHSITYDDRGSWPLDADGGGASLTLSITAPGQDLNQAGAWSSSVSELGTPGIKAVIAPLILSAPNAATVEEGGTYFAEISVIGKSPLVAQWLRNGQPIGEPVEILGTVANLTIENLTLAESGTIVLSVTNAFGADSSEPVAITVIPRSTAPGSLDIAFATGQDVAASDLIALPGGDLLVVGSIVATSANTATSVARFNGNGVLDPGFHISSFREGTVTGAALMDDGRIALCGSFTSVDRLPRPGVVILLSNGEVDTSFQPNFTVAGGALAILAQRDGSLIVGGQLVASSADARFHNLYRVFPSGRLDGAFTQNLKSLVSMTSTWRYHDKGETFGTEWRTAGFDDSAWPEGAALLYVEQAAIEGPVNTRITLTRGATSYYFRQAMWNPFDSEVIVDLQVSYFADDGLVAYLNGEEILRKRLPVGTILPETLAAQKVANAREEGPYIVPRVTLRPGNNILAVEVHQDTPQSSDIVFGLRLESPAQPGGASTLLPGADGAVTVIQPAPDGKIVIGGTFSSVSGTIRRGIARLYPDGSVDREFVPSPQVSSVVALEVQPDGKVVVAADQLVQLMQDGTIDLTFTSPAIPNGVRTIALASDGSIYLATHDVTNNLLHLHPDGTIDDTFDPDSANGYVTQLLVEGNNDRLTLAGGFSGVDTVQRSGLARLIREPGAKSLLLLSSPNLIEWSEDSNAVIDRSAGTVHASPAPAFDALYFKMKGIDGATLTPTHDWTNRYFLKLDERPQ